MLETITLTVAGRILPHISVRLSASAEQAVRNASFDIAWTGAGLPCGDDDPCTIHLSGELWLTGYVRDINWSHDANNRAYSVTIVSRTVDATESSIDHPTGSLEQCDLSEIAAEFDTAGIGVECDIATEPKAVHQIIPGETLYETIRSEARANGALVYDTPKGKLKVADKPEGRHAGSLALGVNILRARGSLSGRFNFSEVKVRGQASFGTTGSALFPEAEAKGTADRKRTLIIYHEGEATSSRMKKRSAWEAKRAAGKGKTAQVTIAGCRDQAGKMYAPNHLIQMTDDWAGIDQDMIIAAVSFDQDSEGGTTTTLTLKDPRALGGENPRGKSAGGWAAPAVPMPTFREDQ